MAEIKTPCSDCAHEVVCSVKSCMEQTEVKTTHPYIIVVVECQQFLRKQVIRSI